MVDYRVEARTKTGVFLTSLPYSNLSCDFFLSKDHEARFDLPMRHRDVTYDTVMPALTEVAVVRNNKDIFVGPVTAATSDSNGNKLNVTANGLTWYLNQMMFQRTLTFGDYYGNIAWNLINEYNSYNYANFGINRGLAGISGHTHSYTVDATEAKKVRDMIDSDLAPDMVEGFDYLIDVNRNFSVWAPRRVRYQSRLLTFGKEITRHSVQIQAANMGNYQNITGADASGNKLNGIAQSPTIAQRWGLYMNTHAYSNLNTQADINARATYIASIESIPQYVLTLVTSTRELNPYAGDFDFGDVFDVYINDGWTQVNEPQRIVGWRLEVGRQLNETISLYTNDLREVPN